MLKVDQLGVCAFPRNSEIQYLIEDCQLTDPALAAAHREAGELIAIFTTIVSKVRSTL
jgi:hypothetical protein